MASTVKGFRVHTYAIAAMVAAVAILAIGITTIRGPLSGDRTAIPLPPTASYTGANSWMDSHVAVTWDHDIAEEIALQRPPARLRLLSSRRFIVFVAERSLSVLIGGQQVIVVPNERFALEVDLNHQSRVYGVFRYSGRRQTWIPWHA
jgi:hypothetical protein